MKQSIYLMTYDNLYKIGISNNPEQRHKTFLTGNPKIKLVCYSEPVSFAYTLEQKLHSILSKKNKNGEWFKLSEQDKANVIKLIENLTEDTRIQKLIENI